MIFAYDDSRAWGRKLVSSAKKIGCSARLFRKAEEVPDDEDVVVFLRMANTPEARDQNKKLAASLRKKSKITMIPNGDECFVYDEKVKQFQKFNSWMPRTWLIQSPEEAEKVLEEIGLPFISKANEGSSSQNVRYITDIETAKKEIRDVFSSEGKRLYYDDIQKGYLLWQRFVPGNDGDIRIDLIAGKYAYVVKRYNRDDVPLASGSGKAEAVTEIDDGISELLDFGLKFSKDNKLSFVALDIVRDNGRPVLLEASCAWSQKAGKSRIFMNSGGKWHSTGFTAATMFDLIVKAIVEGDFNGNSKGASG